MTTKSLSSARRCLPSESRTATMHQHDDPSNDAARVQCLLAVARRAPISDPQLVGQHVAELASHALTGDERRNWFRVLVDAVMVLRWRDATPGALADATDRATLAAAALVCGPIA